jgi:DNA-binding NarL/FixJ family response regulator
MEAYGDASETEADDGGGASAVHGRALAVLDSAGVSAFLLDRGLQVRAATREGLAFLREAAIARVVSGRLQLNAAEADARFQDALSICASEDRLQSLRIESDRGAWACRVGPLPTGSALQLVATFQPAASHEGRSGLLDEGRLRSLYRLTEAEAEIVTALASGLTPAGIASLRRASLSTVRTQIRSVYVKTGACRQAELVALVLKTRSATTA